MKNLFKKWQREGSHPLLVALAGRIYRWSPLALKDLKHALRYKGLPKQLTEKRPPEEWVDFIFERFSGALKPIQKKTEIAELVRLLESLAPKRILEIGTANGGTLFLLCRALAPSGKALSVDLPGGWFGGGYPPWRKWVYRQFAAPSQEVTLFRANSHLDSTLERVRQWLGGEKFNFILIDGDHTYEGAKLDLRLYSAFLAEDGVIALHDIVPQTDADCGVSRLWPELCQQYETVALVESWQQNGLGIGVLLNAGRAYNAHETMTAAHAQSETH